MTRFSRLRTVRFIVNLLSQPVLLLYLGLTCSNAFAAEVDDSGVCTSDGDSYAACRKVLLPRQPALQVQTPGSFIIGQVWGKDGKAMVFGPSVGLGAVASLPVRLPTLERVNGNSWKRPTEMRFFVNWDIGINGGLTGLKLQTSDTTDKTQMGYTAGVFTGPQLGWVWYPDGVSEKRVGLTLGIVAAYLADVDGIGDAFLFGIQPSISTKF